MEQARPGTYPNRIRELRNSRGLTLEALAERIEATHATVQRLEAGRIQLTSSKIFALSRELKCHPGELFAPLPTVRDPDEELAAAFVRGMDPDEKAAWFQTAKVMTRRGRGRRSA